MEYLYSKLVSLVLAPFILWGSILQPTPVAQTFGTALPQTVAVFETSLASPITSSATTMTLTANAIRGGGALSGYNCFTIDEGSAQAETTCGTVSSTSVTGLSRGISQANGTTTVAALQFAHRRGANVKITDFPIIQLLKAQNNGEETFDNPLRYATTTSTTTVALNGQNLASVAYVNGLSFGAIPPASETAAGFVELATGEEVASSTSSGGTGYRLAIPATVATSTFYSASASSNKIPVTNGEGVLDRGFIASSTNFTVTNNFYASGTSTFASSTTIGGLNAFDISQKNIQVFTASSTFTVPAGVKLVDVELIGGGASGRGAPNGDSSIAPDGGGGGAYVRKIINVTGTSSIFITIGAGGINTGASPTNGDGGTTSFGNFLSAAGGDDGSGGIASGGTININGYSGTTGVYISGASSVSWGGAGGGSVLGRGAKAPITTGSSPSINGINAATSTDGYGSGGSSVVHTTGDGGKTAGNGSQGIAIIRW